jgi:enamine deaminase RidA (YjgF/YER057c/UK114 family)
MSQFRRHGSASPYEAQAGFCRALRVGDRVLVAGTAPIGPDGSTVAPGRPLPQARRCLEVIGEALRALDCGLEHVVRTRIYITDAAHWEAVGQAHGETFGGDPPVATCVVVAGLLDPEWTVEIEAEAVVPQD